MSAAICYSNSNWMATQDKNLDSIKVSTCSVGGGSGIRNKTDLQLKLNVTIIFWSIIIFIFISIVSDPQFCWQNVHWSWQTHFSFRQCAQLNIKPLTRVPNSKSTFNHFPSCCVCVFKLEITIKLYRHFRNYPVDVVACIIYNYSFI